MSAIESFEWGFDPDRTTGIVYAVRRVEIARFTDAEDAQDYCRWRNGQREAKPGDETPPPADIPSPEADADRDFVDIEEFVDALQLGPRSDGLTVPAVTIRAGPIVGEMTVTVAEAGRIWGRWPPDVDMTNETVEQDEAPAAPADQEPVNSATSCEPDETPAAQLVGEQQDQEAAAGDGADIGIPITETSPEMGIPITEPDPTRGDPYHEAGEAFRRLKAGEKLGSVADDLGLNMPRLRSRWSNYQKGLQAMAWQPGATVAKPAAPPSEADDGWAVCPRCRTKFNAAKAQQIAKLPQRPTHCAACR